MSLSLKGRSIEDALDRLENGRECREMIRNQRRFISSSAGRICDLLEKIGNNDGKKVL